jgi:hypothetical protein
MGGNVDNEPVGVDGESLHSYDRVVVLVDDGVDG